MSLFMMGQFLFPLTLGTGAAKLLQRRGKIYPDSLTRTLWRLGVVTLTLASCLTGVFEIYGAPAPLLRAHWIVGTALLLRTLTCMREEGYGYAIIGWVDDAEQFYRKTVNAEWIPGGEPENTVYSNLSDL